MSEKEKVPFDGRRFVHADLSDGGAVLITVSRDAPEEVVEPPGAEAVRSLADAAARLRPIRLPGRPRGPERKHLGVRVLAATNLRFTLAVLAEQVTPQDAVDAVLAAWCDDLGVPEDVAEVVESLREMGLSDEDLRRLGADV